MVFFQKGRFLIEPLFFMPAPWLWSKYVHKSFIVACFSQACIQRPTSHANSLVNVTSYCGSIIEVLLFY